MSDTEYVFKCCKCKNPIQNPGVRAFCIPACTSCKPCTKDPTNVDKMCRICGCWAEPCSITNCKNTVCPYLWTTRCATCKKVLCVYHLAPDVGWTYIVPREVLNGTALSGRDERWDSEWLYCKICKKLKKNAA